MQQPFRAAPHDDILLLLVQLAVLLLAARALGEVARRLKQPAVIGEILAGILLGPSLLSGLFPVLGRWIIPQTELSGYLLETIAMFGAFFLLILTGLETDLPLIRRQARTGVGASLGGLLLPFVTGFLLGEIMPADLLADPSRRTIFSLFMATAMSISAIPVIARVLIDLNLMRRDVGQIILAAGMSDDTVGWILLSIVAGLAAGQAVTAGSLLQSVGSVLGFMLISFTIGRWLVKRSLDFVQDNMVSHDRLLTLIVVMALLWGAISQALHLEAILGAFIVGMLFGQMPRLPATVHQKLESISLAIFTPLFFAVAGLKVNLLSLLNGRLLLVALIVLSVAIFGKVAGGYLGSRFIGGRDHWSSLTFGFGLNARGAMGIVVASIGLSLGILSQDIFSIIVLLAIVTTLMTPPMMRWAVRHLPEDPQEAARLQEESLASASPLSRVHRVLLPVRPRDLLSGENMQTIESRILDMMGKDAKLSVTLLHVAPPGRRAENQRFVNDLASKFSQSELVKKVVESQDISGAILDELQKDYDLLVLGASERHRSADILFTPMVDSLVRMAPCPTLVVKRHPVASGWSPHRILVPTNGSRAAKSAAEVAFSLRNGGAHEVTILNVPGEGPSADTYPKDLGLQYHERREAIAQEIVGELQQLGNARGVDTHALVRNGAEPERVIVDMAIHQTADLIVLGTDLRPGHGRLYLGPRVEWVLEHAPCPVIVVNVP